jgi:hypothetical protein
MKTKKSAASAALKTTDKKSTTIAPVSTPSAPKSTSIAATTTPAAPKSASVTPVSTPSAPKLTDPAPTTAPSAPKTASAALTTIEVKLDVGFGNALFLRGQGSGLNWERGVPLECVDGSTWRWVEKVAAPVTFKVLLNDQIWSAGSDCVVAPGQKVELSPSFA